MFIINFLKMMKRKNRMRLIKQYVQLSIDTIYGSGFSVDLRKPKTGYTFLKIGQHCVIDGRFIFEKDSGYIEIGDRVHIGQSQFISINQILIGNDVTIAWGCLFYDHNSHSIYWDERKNDTVQEYKDYTETGNAVRNKNWSVVKSEPIIIKDKAWIGVGCKILKGVTIGEGAIVGAGSVVTHDVPDWTVVGGNPAAPIKNLKC